MRNLRNIHFQFLKQKILLTSDLFNHEAIKKRLDILDKSNNPVLFIGNEEKIIIPNINNAHIFQQLFFSFKEFINQKSPR